MGTKLTLNIEKEIIEKAKSYARSRGRSLSDLVENYFKLIIGSETENAEVTSMVKSLKGSIKAPGDLDYKQVLGEELAKKHLR